MLNVDFSICQQSELHSAESSQDRRPNRATCSTCFHSDLLPYCHTRVLIYLIYSISLVQHCCVDMREDAVGCVSDQFTLNLVDFHWHPFFGNVLIFGIHYNISLPMSDNPQVDDFNHLSLISNLPYTALANVVNVPIKW